MRVLKSERGFTAVEVIIAVTILGVIALPLAMSLSQALTLVPQADSRSTSAANRIFMTDSWARDTLNAVNVNAAADTSFACTTAASHTDLFYDATWTDGGDAVQVKYEMTQTREAAGEKVRRVDIGRKEFRNGTQTSDEIIATGFCDQPVYAAAGKFPLKLENQLVSGDLHRRVHLTLTLQPRRELAPEVVDFEGALGKTK